MSYHVNERATTAIPLYLAPDLGSGAVRENLSSRARAYLDGLEGGLEGDAPRVEAAGLEVVTADALFHHALAVLHAPAYRAENAGALSQDWPRVPLPSTLEALLASAALGRRVAALLDPEAPLPDDARAPALRRIAVPDRAGGGALDPAVGDLAVSLKWGYLGGAGQVMPGKDYSEARPFSGPERAALEDAADVLGPGTVDVYLNERALWRGVPAAVWSYTLGGYPVLKKWLSYRQRDVLGRDLTAVEARYFQSVARRIAALLLLDPALDAAYAAART